MSVKEGVKYPCDQCDYKATLPHHLQQHIKSIHDGVKYPCNKCDYKATRPDNLQQHIKSIHDGVKYRMLENIQCLNIERISL